MVVNLTLAEKLKDVSLQKDSHFGSCQKAGKEAERVLKEICRIMEEEDEQTKPN